MAHALPGAPLPRSSQVERTALGGTSESESWLCGLNREYFSSLLNCKCGSGDPTKQNPGAQKFVRALCKQWRVQLAHLQRPLPPTQGQKKGHWVQPDGLWLGKKKYMLCPQQLVTSDALMHPTLGYIKLELPQSSSFLCLSPSHLCCHRQPNLACYNLPTISFHIKLKLTFLLYIFINKPQVWHAGNTYFCAAFHIWGDTVVRKDHSTAQPKMGGNGAGRNLI